MRTILLNIFIIALTLTACNKKDDDEIGKNVKNPYKLPWKTESIHYENLSMCNGSHSSGYKIYYKDSLLMEECTLGSTRISNSLLTNDSILHLFVIRKSNSSYDLLTKNGGHSWEEIHVGPPEIYKIHYVNLELVYCVTINQNDLYFTGIWKSNLSNFKDSLTKGRHYITDLGTNISDMDSTVITLNDSVDFVIKFKD